MSEESMTLDDKIKMLRDAGFDLAWADRDDIWPQGEVSGHIRSLTYPGSLALCRPGSPEFRRTRTPTGAAWPT